MNVRWARRAWCAAAFGAAAEVVLPRLAFADAGRTHLFTIGRSKNENLVCYDWIGGPPGRGPGRLDVYWIMAAERGQRDELSGLERELAYGYRVVQSSPAGTLTILLKAAPSRPIVIHYGGVAPRATTLIGSNQATLESIYVATKEGALIPVVLYVEIRGRSPAGEQVQERVERRKA